MLEIAVYGAGYVGLVSSVCFAHIGHRVWCADIDTAKIQALTQGNCPIYEPGLDSLIAQAAHLEFSNDIADVARKARIHIIAVGTPQGDDGHADLSAYFQVLESIISQQNDDFTIINKSTVPVGTCERVLTLLGDRFANINFSVVSNPEFLREGCAIQDFLNPDRIIIGCEEGSGLQTANALYAPLTKKGVPLLNMSPSSAELTKYAANAMLATKISFINEISQIAEQTGADIESVREGMSFDHRIGAHFINPGCGYGGSCFPKDVSALSALSENPTPMLDAVQTVNTIQKQSLFKKLQQCLTSLSGKTIALWGLAFKPQTDDMREASSMVFIHACLNAGVNVQAFDPVAKKTAKKVFATAQGLTLVDSIEASLQSADALVIATEWDCFKAYNPENLCGKLTENLIIDGRNIWPLKTIPVGLNYLGVGRCRQS